jgi:hypothetical protein
LGWYKGLSQFRQNKEYWVLLIFSSFSMQLILWRPGYMNFQRVLPAILVIGLILVLNIKSKRIRKRFQQFGGLLFGLVALDSLYINPQLYESIGIRFLYHTPIRNPKFPMICDRFQANMIDNFTENIIKVEPVGGSFLCLPFHPLWNYLTGFPNPTKYEWLLPGTITDEAEMRVMIGDIRQAAPDVVLLDDTPFDQNPDRSFSRLYPDLSTWFLLNYFAWLRAGEFAILMRIPDNGTRLLRDLKIAEVEWGEGNNEIRNVEFFSEIKPVLLQQGDSSIAVTSKLPARAVFRAVCRMDAGQSGRSVGDFEALLSFTPEEGSFLAKPASCSMKCQSLEADQFKEFLWDLSRYEGISGELVFAIATNENVPFEWIDPCVFSWPDILPSVDTPSHEH